MKPEIKTAIIFGIVIVVVIGGLSGVFSSIETSQTLELDEDKEQDQGIQNIDKSRFVTESPHRSLIQGATLESK